MKRKLTPRDERATVNHEFDSIDQFVREYVTNISRSGVFIRSKDPLPVGTKVDLKFTIFSEDPEVIEGVGEVVRRSKEPRGMGVVFISLTSVSETIIARLLTRRSAAGVPLAAPPRTSPPPPPGARAGSEGVEEIPLDAEEGEGA